MGNGTVRALVPMQPSRAGDVRQALAQLRDALADAPPVDLELRLARAAGADAAAALRDRCVHCARQARQKVLELRQLDLQLALEGAGALREDVEDERAAVDDLAAERLLEVALLRGRERIVEDDDVALASRRRRP